VRGLHCRFECSPALTEACCGQLADNFELGRGLSVALFFFHGSWWLWLYKLRLLSGLGGGLLPFEILESELVTLCASQFECGEPIVSALV
jgi:hypothetical protein